MPCKEIYLLLWRRLSCCLRKAGKAAPLHASPQIRDKPCILGEAQHGGFVEVVHRRIRCGLAYSDRIRSSSADVILVVAVRSDLDAEAFAILFRFPRLLNGIVDPFAKGKWDLDHERVQQAVGRR